jgi:hypothetical protein
MGGRSPNLKECGLGVPLLTLVVGDDRVVLTYDQSEHRLWMIDVQGDSAGATPVRGDYQETTLSRRRILGGSAPASVTEVSVLSEGREPQKGLSKTGSGWQRLPAAAVMWCFGTRPEGSPASWAFRHRLRGELGPVRACLASSAGGWLGWGALPTVSN